ncbi:uncharacterized protein LOC119480935 [Sebastes umbrosus]|uniref:uncharacterized protein LOC119480935 n=1 Tax=Sebastes umbrosus TaxID=72105 RepID=UPI00189E4B1B|nr:uncharacterized protein LOC119480935 [Sebastes umbrosus]
MRGAVRGRGRPKKSTLAEMERKNAERTVEFEPPLDGAMAAGDEEEEPVVRPKILIDRVASEELSATDFFEEMREFMRRSRQTEAVLFDQIKQLRGEMGAKSTQDWMSDEQYEQPDQHYPHAIPAGVLKLQAETSMHLPTVKEPKKFIPLQASGPVSSLQQLLPQQQQRASPPTRSVRPHVSEPRIPDFKEGEDPESFFVRFERMARTWGWQPVEWAARVVTLLTGKALDAYAGMDEEQAESYEAVKAAVLMKFNVTEETYRQRFRSTIVPVGETVRETYNRIKGLYKRWMRPNSRTKEQIGESIVLEQYLRVLQPDIRTWVKENDPQTGEEAADLAERYTAAHGDPSRKKLTVGKSRFGETKPYGLPVVDNKDIGVGKKPVHSNLKPNFTCFYCQQPGHKASFCPLKRSKTVELCSVPRPDNDDHDDVNENEMIPHRHVVDVTVNGHVAKALADTGSSQTLVKSSLLHNSLTNFERNVNITCVHGCRKDYPTAEVIIEVEGQAFMLTVGALDHLAYDVILGEDLPVLDNLVQQNSRVYSCAVVTRSVTKGQVRGPLDMLKENWVAGVATSPTTNIISYILQMRDKLESCRERVKENMLEAQHKQKVESMF